MDVQYDATDCGYTTSCHLGVRILHGTQEAVVLSAIVAEKDVTFLALPYCLVPLL